MDRSKKKVIQVFFIKAEFLRRVCQVDGLEARMWIPNFSR